MNNGNYEISVDISTNRYSQTERNSIRNTWATEESKMIDLGFSEELIDFYEAHVMNPNRYTLRDHISRDVPEEWEHLHVTASMMRRLML